MFGGQPVKAGTYTLFTIPSDENWIVILSNQRNVWGSYFYDAKEDVVRVEAEVAQGKESIEAFSTVFTGEENDALMHLAWGTTRVTISVKG